MDVERQRLLGADIASVLDKYGVFGANRVLVLLAVIWAEACKLKIGASNLGQMAIQAWRHHAAGGDFYGRSPRDPNA